MSEDDVTDRDQRIRVGHSPDPDDAFMFFALAKDRIETGRYLFEHELVDIETLNRRAFEGDPRAFGEFMFTTVVLADGLAKIKPTTVTVDLPHAAPAFVTTTGRTIAGTSTTTAALPGVTGVAGLGGPTALAMSNEAAKSGETKKRGQSDEATGDDRDRDQAQQRQSFAIPGMSRIPRLRE